ncbi:MAG: acyl-CoA desaturase [Cyanobacteria bacterium P01_E01_bin.6]
MSNQPKSHNPIAAQSKITVYSRYLQQIKQRFILGMSVLSLTGCAIAAYQLVTVQVILLSVCLLLGAYCLTSIGITVGFHRYFSHKTFQTTRPIQIALAILGSMAEQGSVTAWVSVHRCHHQYSDKLGDPHSPHLHGSGLQGNLRELWYARIGWLLDSQLPNSMLFAKDLQQDAVIAQINRLYVVWISLGIVIPSILGLLLIQTWLSAFQELVWGGLARLFFSSHSIAVMSSTRLPIPGVAAPLQWTTAAPITLGFPCLPWEKAGITITMAFPSQPNLGWSSGKWNWVTGSFGC